MAKDNRRKPVMQRDIRYSNNMDPAQKDRQHDDWALRVLK